VEAVALERAHLVVLQHDVGPLRQFLHDGATFRPVDADRGRALAAVDGKVVAGLPGLAAWAVLPGWRPPAAGVVALAGTLHLHHSRPEIRQYLAGPWGGQDAAEVQHLDMRKRPAAPARFRHFHVAHHRSVAAPVI